MKKHDSCVGLFAVLLTLFLSSVCVVVGSFTLMREAAAIGECCYVKVRGGCLVCSNVYMSVHY